MSLGVAALGGSSVPDYGVATIIACAFAKQPDKGPEVGMTDWSSLLVCWAYRWTFYSRSATPSIAQKSGKYANEKQFGKMYAILYLCPVMVAVFMAFPTAVALTAGAPLVQAILDVLPSWVTGGLSVAGKLLPWSWYCHVAPLHAGKEVLQLHSDRLCTQRIHGRTRSLVSHSLV